MKRLNFIIILLTINCFLSLWIALLLRAVLEAKPDRLSMTNVNISQPRIEPDYSTTGLYLRSSSIKWVTNAISFTRAELTVSYKYSEPGKNMRSEDVTVWSAIKPTVVEKDGGWQITFDHQDELTPAKVNTGYNQPLLHQFGIPSDEQIIGTSLDAPVAGFPPRIVTTDKGIYEFDGKKYQPKQNP